MKGGGAGGGEVTTLCLIHFPVSYAALKGFTRIPRMATRGLCLKLYFGKMHSAKIPPFLHSI